RGDERDPRAVPDGGESPARARLAAALLARGRARADDRVVPRLSRESMSRETECRACASRALAKILSLGTQPLANALLERADAPPEARSPLELVFCESCSLVQITETVPPETLFRDYVYFSSFSDTMVEHAQKLAQRLVDARELTKKSLVLEVASNDGYLLQH